MVEGFPWVIFVEKRTGRWTDQPTNGPSYRDARTHLKTDPFTYYSLFFAPFDAKKVFKGNWGNLQKSHLHIAVYE